MASIDSYLGPGTSAIGQGQAFVLPEGKAGEYQMHLSQTHAAQLQAAAQFQRLQQQKIQEQYYKDLHDQKLPEFYAPYGKTINDANAAWQKKWANEYAKTGKNPFNNPDAIDEYNKTVLVPARQSKDLGEQYAKLMTDANTDREGKYTDESKAAVLNHLENLQKDPLSYLGKPLPSLQPKPATFDDLYKTIKPTAIKQDNGYVKSTVADDSGHKQQAYISVEGNPKWDGVKLEYGINPVLGDFGSMYNKDGKRVWYTNPAATEHKADFILKNASSPENAGILQKLKISPDEPYALERLQDAIIQQNKGYGKLVTDLANKANSQVEKETSKVYDADNNAMQHSRLDLSKEAAGRDKQRLQKTLSNDNDRLKWVNDIQSGHPDAVKSLQAALEELPGRAKVKKVSTGLVVDIPEMVPTLDIKGNTVPGQKHLEYKRYHIGTNSGRSGRIIIEGILNKLQVVGSEKTLKTEPYKPTYNDIGNIDSADDL